MRPLEEVGSGCCGCSAADQTDDQATVERCKELRIACADFFDGSEIVQAERMLPQGADLRLGVFVAVRLLDKAWARLATSSLPSTGRACSTRATLRNGVYQSNGSGLSAFG